jgi:hypothetical protein
MTPMSLFLNSAPSRTVSSLGNFFYSFEISNENLRFCVTTYDFCIKKIKGPYITHCKL